MACAVLEEKGNLSMSNRGFFCTPDAGRNGKVGNRQLPGGLFERQLAARIPDSIQRPDERFHQDGIELPAGTTP
jgi:hypothetical protein